MIEVKQMVRNIGPTTNAETDITSIYDVDYQVAQYLNDGYSLINRF